MSEVMYDKILGRLRENGGNGGGGDSVINDNTIADNTTWSSQKIDEQLSSPLVAPTAVDGISIKNSNRTIVTVSGSVLYYIPIKAGETIRANFRISESYSQCGLTTTLPAVDVVVSSYSSGGVGTMRYQKTASADGYFCISFTKKSSIEKLEITKVNETKTIGDKVFDLEKSVKVLNEHPLRIDFGGTTGSLANHVTFEVDSNSRYRIGLPNFDKTSDSSSLSFFKVGLSPDGENFTTYYTRMSDDVVPQEFYVETGTAKFCELTLRNGEDITVTVEKCDSYGIFDFNSREKIEVALNNMKKTVVSYGTEPLTLVHFSDIHADTANLKRIAEFGEAMKGKIDDIIHTGDIVEDTADASSFDFWSAVNGTAGILNVIGNHDFHYASGFTPTATFEYDTYFAPYVSGWGVAQPTDAAANNRCYYYKDYTDQGVRLIVLDIRPYNQADTSEKAAQKTWLETVLAEAMEQRLAVIVACHYPPDFQDNFDTGFNTDTRVYPLWDAFAPSDWTDAVDDFMSDGGEFVCWLCGHNHKDYAGVFIAEGSTNRQVCLLVDCARMYNNSTVKYRAISTKSQDSFNIVSVNRNNKVITVMKVGNDMNYMVRPINSMAIDYESGRLIYGGQR